MPNQRYGKLIFESSSLRVLQSILQSILKFSNATFADFAAISILSFSPISFHPCHHSLHFI